MFIFAIEHIPEIQGKIDFYKLKINGICEFDLFIEQCIKHGGYESEIITIQSRMQQVSELRSMPETKFRDITPQKELYKEYEIKTRNLRIYMFHDKIKGRIIVLGGKKGTQKRDIQRFRNIKEFYLK